jgi:hypothetical protein
VDGLVLAIVVSARLAVPLAILRYPLPAMLACLVIDGLDQTIFQTFTDLDLTGYQSYDKALDVYYLAIAYVATMRNWVNLVAFDVSRFLFFYRLVGVVAFELTQVRALLLVFPNTFEYFFDFYEAVRVRWDPRRMARRLLIAAAAAIWVFIKLPQEWWIHVAQLDMTDFLKESVFGVPTDASWGEAVANNPSIVVIALLIVAAAAGLIRWIVLPRLPPADHPPTFDADARQPAVDPLAVERERRRMAVRLFDRELAEKFVLVALMSVIFAEMLGLEAEPLGVVLGIGALIAANTAVSEWLVRRERSWASTLAQFGTMLAVNLGIVLVGRFVIAIFGGAPLDQALVFVLLLSLVVTLYDRYRPVHLARFGT